MTNEVGSRLDSNHSEVAASTKAGRAAAAALHSQARGSDLVEDAKARVLPCLFVNFDADQCAETRRLRVWSNAELTARARGWSAFAKRRLGNPVSALDRSRLKNHEQ